MQDKSDAGMGYGVQVPQQIPQLGQVHVLGPVTCAVLPPLMNLMSNVLHTLVLRVHVPPPVKVMLLPVHTKVCVPSLQWLNPLFHANVFIVGPGVIVRVRLVSGI